MPANSLNGLHRVRRGRDRPVRFIAVRGWLDCRPVERDGRVGVEFTWDGVDEGDQVSGRGWASLVDDATIEGLMIAAQTSLPLEQIADDPGELAAWVKRLPVVVEKDRLLRRVVHGDAARIRIEMLRRFRGENAPNIPVPTPPDRGRSARRRRTAAIRPWASAGGPARGGGSAPREGPSAGPRTTTGRTRARGNRRVVTRRRVDRHPKPAEYYDAATLLTDLQALAERDGRHDTFAHYITALRQAHTRKPSLIERLDRAGV
jgi:hypothetical protein